MSEGDSGAGPPIGPTGASQGRPRRRRRGPARPHIENAGPAAAEGAAVEQRPLFRPLDAEPLVSTSTVSLGAEASEEVSSERAEAMGTRRPRRRRSTANGQATRTEAIAPSTSAEPDKPADAESSEPQVLPADADSDAPQVLAADAESSEPQVLPANVQSDAPQIQPPAPARGRSRRSVSDTIDVNVVVPRGLGRRVNSKLIQQVVQLAVQREGWEQPASLDVVIVSDEEMREINVTRRGIDEATDVLSFPMVELRPESGVAEDFFVLPPETQVHLGDVVISLARVESQADEAGHSRERELAFLTVHAVLHILGYDHDTEDQRRRMRRREEDVLVELGLRRNGA